MAGRAHREHEAVALVELDGVAGVEDDAVAAHRALAQQPHGLAVGLREPRLGDEVKKTLLPFCGAEA